MPCVSDALVQVKDRGLYWNLDREGQKDGGQIESWARTKYQNEKAVSDYELYTISPILYELSKNRVTPANIWVIFTFLPAN